jgi:mono/diheme cytochrome c family protein
MRQTVKGVLVILLFSALAAGQQAGPETKSAGPSKNEPVSGKQLYVSYCAMCHGTDATGGGPFSTQLKVWPPDLTQLANKNNGTYPVMRVSEMIDGEFGKASAHGSREMPIWGPVFRAMAHGHNDSAQLRISNVVKYLESLQKK